MAAPDRIEVATALYGAWRLIRGDAGGTAYFRAGRDGFWTATWAILLVIPGHLITLGLHVADNEVLAFGFDDVVRETEILVIGWFGYALLVHYALRGMGRLNRYDGYLTAYYWTTVPLVYAETLLTFLRVTGLLPTALLNLLAFAVLIAILWSRWFVARIGLGVSGPEAAGVAIATLLFEFFVTKTLSPLL
jgi:hypothetical protein